MRARTIVVVLVAVGILFAWVGYWVAIESPLSTSAA